MGMLTPVTVRFMTSLRVGAIKMNDGQIRQSEIVIVLDICRGFQKRISFWRNLYYNSKYRV
ncbi:hypothetical protein NFHkm12_05170 [Latilactobacillus curvatus]|nr:hypothetical protein NFHkm12_05170 [Latilactobacillus curvatus]